MKLIHQLYNGDISRKYVFEFEYSELNHIQLMKQLKD